VCQADEGFHNRAGICGLLVIHNKGAVNFHFGKRQALQLLQGGIARSKIVNGKAKALQPHPRQCFHGADSVCHNRGFRDFHRHCRGFDTRLVTVLNKIIQHQAAGNRGGRKVDTGMCLQPPVPPFCKR